MAGQKQLTLPTRSALITSDPARSGSPDPRPPRRLPRKPTSHEVEAAWHNFSTRLGKHLSMRQTGQDSWELVTDSTGLVGTTCAHKASTRVPHIVTSQGRTYIWRKVGRKRVLARHRVVDLVDVATNSPVLRMSGLHLNCRAATRLTLVGQCELRFPVTGRKRHALMSAIDESGNSLVDYRLVPSQFGSDAWTEAVISPKAMTLPHIELLVAVSSPFLLEYFQPDAGG